MYRDENQDPYNFDAAPLGEAYAEAAYVEPAQASYVAIPHAAGYAGTYGGEAYDEAYESGAYADATAAPMVSPWLIQQLSATPLMVDGQAAVEVVMTVVRDYDRAAEACPYEGYDILGWHNEVVLALRANRHGRWVAFVPAVGGFQPLGIGDGASVNLDRHEMTAAWRFIPEMLGQFDLWAYVYVNGVFVPFDEMMASEHYVDANGAAKLSVLL